MLTTAGNLRRFLLEAASRTPRILTDETLLTLQQWIRNHKKIKQRQLKTAMAELWEKGQPASGLKLFRGLGMTSSELTSLVGKPIDRKSSRQSDPKIPGNVLAHGTLNGSFQYMPRRAVDSWTVDLKKAEEFAEGPMANASVDFRVVLAADGGQNSFRRIPTEVYETEIVDTLYVGPWAWEKETLAFGPVAVTGVMWSDWYFSDEQRQQLVR